LRDAAGIQPPAAAGRAVPGGEKTLARWAEPGRAAGTAALSEPCLALAGEEDRPDARL